MTEVEKAYQTLRRAGHLVIGLAPEDVAYTIKLEGREVNEELISHVIEYVQESGYGYEAIMREVVAAYEHEEETHEEEE
mgnify:CR=1 FL=1